jgi:hypothetical protein
MKTVYSAGGTALPFNEPFVLNGIAYAGNWLSLASPDDLAERGITVEEVDDSVPPIAPPEPSDVPDAVTPRQARLALLEAGLLDQVEQSVTAAGGATKIAWDFASLIERQDPLIISIGAALNLTDDQIDVLFKYAATI